MEIIDGVVLIEDLTTIAPIVAAYISFVPLIMLVKVIFREVLDNSGLWKVIDIYLSVGVAVVGLFVFLVFVLPADQVVVPDRCKFVEHKYVVRVESDADLLKLTETYNVTSVEGDNLFILTEKN